MTRIEQQVNAVHRQIVERSSPAFTAYDFIIEQHAIDAAFLWLLRSQVVYTSTLYYPSDIAELDRRIYSNLRSLVDAGQLGWSACLDQLDLEEAGETFVAAVVAFKSGDKRKMKNVCSVALDNDEVSPGLISALGWIDDASAQHWIDRFLEVEDPRYQYLGISASSIRRTDPGQTLTKILQRDDIDQYPNLYARCLRLIGEMKRADLVPALNQGMNADHQVVRFWAIWSAVLLGNHAAVEQLKPFVLADNPNRGAALQMAFNGLPLETARQWISEMSKEPENMRAVIQAAGALGDPTVVPWLIKQMHDEKHARIAGLSFSLLTGIDLEQSSLDKEVEIEFEDSDENEIDDDADSEDSDLPWPDPIKLRSFWDSNGSNYPPGSRYFLGNRIEPDNLRDAIAGENQLVRSSAALKLAMLESPEPLTNIAVPKLRV